MNVNGKTKIYRKDFNGKPAYSRAISSQEYSDGKKGDWISAYEIVQFPRGTDMPDRTYVDIQEAFEAVYKSGDSVRRKLVVTKFNVIEYPRRGFDQLKDDDIPF